MALWLIVILELILIVILKLRQDYVNGVIRDTLLEFSRRHLQNTKDITKIKALIDSKFKVKTGFWLQ